MNEYPLGDFNEFLFDAQAYEQEKRARRKTFSRIGLSLLVLLLTTFVMQYVVYGLVAWLAQDVLSAWWLDWVLSFVPLYAFGLPAFIFSFVGLGRSENNHTYVSKGMILPKPTFKWYHFLLLTVLGFGLLYIGNFIGTILMTLMSAIVGYDYQNALSSIVDNSPTWMVFLGTVIIAPIGEEFLFRKLLIDRIRGYGDVAAILISAISFGLFHGNFFQFFYATLLGLVLAYMYTWSGKIWWSVSLHMIINLMGSIVMPWLVGQLNLEGDPTTDPTVLVDYLLALGIELIIGALIIGAIVITICLLCMRKVYVGKGSVGCRLRTQDKWITTLGNVGIIVALVVYGLYILLSLIPV